MNEMTHLGRPVPDDLFQADANRIRVALEVLNRLELCAARALEEPGFAHEFALTDKTLGAFKISVSKRPT